MNETPLEDQVHDSLHRRADGVQRAPLNLSTVRTRARRIQRRRRVAAGAAIAAVLAIAVPVGLTMSGGSQRSDLPIAPEPPPSVATGTVVVDPVTAPDGDETPVGIIDVDEQTLDIGDESTDLPGVYDQITPYLDGWLAMANSEQVLTAQVLDADFTVLEQAPSDGLVLSPDGTRVAWTEYVGGRWTVVDADTGGAREVRRTALPGSGDDVTVTAVGMASDTDVVVRQRSSTGTVTTSYVVGPDGVRKIAGMEAQAASAATGRIAGITRRAEDNSTCSSVVDADAPDTPLWETCDHTLVSFSPDGRFVVGFADYLDGNGSPTLDLLDADTGEEVVNYDLAGSRSSLVGISEVVWEDDAHLLVLLVKDMEQSFLRIGLDGTVERVGGTAVQQEPGWISLKFATV